VWGRALNGAEVQELWDAGRKVAEATDGVSMDNRYDAANTVVANAPQSVRCSVCQGKRRSNEPAIVRGTSFFHTGCYAARGSNKTITTPTAASPITDYEGSTLRLLHLVLHSLSKRITAWPRNTYFDGTRIQLIGISGTGQADVFIPWGVTGAIVARHGHLPREHWYIDLAISQIEFFWSRQQGDGTVLQPSEFSADKVGLDFVTGPLGEAILYLKPYVSASTWTRWKTNFLRAGDSLYDSKDGSVVPESNFYVNGNREAGELWGLWMMYLISGKQASWLARYEAQYTYMVTLESKLHAGINGGTYGFVTVVAPTQADGSDGKGYLIERKNTDLPAGHVVGPAGSVLDGYDPNYVNLCNQFLVRLYLHSKDARILKIINMQFNLNMDRVNTTNAVGQGGWILDGTGGSRQNNTSSFGVLTVPFLGMTMGYSSRVTPTMVATAFAELTRFESTDTLNSSFINRDVNQLGGWLMCFPNWPGNPTI
jgi:hypothetical protein